MTSKVSICIPAYKQTEYLKKTLDSILIQDFDDYEIIITDDSPDESVRELVSSYDFGGKLSYHKNYVSLGSPANWNAAIAKASGTYIKIMHHDDYFTFDNSLSEFVKAIEVSGSDFVFSACVNLFPASGKTWMHIANYKQVRMLKENPKCLFSGNFIGAPSVTFYRRSAVQYDVNLKWLVDIDFYIQYLLLSKRFFLIERPLMTILGADGRVTDECNSKEVEIPEYIYLYNKIFQDRVLAGKRVLKVFKDLLLKYNIRSFREIRTLVPEGPIPLIFRPLIVYVFLASRFSSQ